jgi:putative hydrolase of the HAD superfamily
MSGRPAVNTVILFDLDDTLYPEADYVRSGHRAIAQTLASRTGNPTDSVYAALRYDYCKFGRAGLFDRIVAAYGLPSSLVKELVRTYRLHTPQLSLDPRVRDLLTDLRKQHKIAVVTDGDANMQKEKVQALGLAGLVDLVVYCWELDARKPDPGAFLHATEVLGGKPETAIIIGDDPTHDVEAALKMETACIRVRAHRFAEIESLTRPALYTEIASVLDSRAAIDRVGDMRG